MKKHILAFAAICLGFGATAQLDLASPPTTVYGGYEDANLSLHFDVHNLGSTAVDVHIFRVDDNNLAGTSNAFCWGQACYPPFTSHSTNPEPIPANGVNTSFIGYYYPDNVQGISTMDYCWYVDGDSANTVTCHTVNYDASFAQGLGELNRESKIGDAYPNPADKMATLEYQVYGRNGKIIFHDMLGALVKEINLDHNQGVALLNVSDLRSGVYFYALEVDGETVATRKLVVAHK